MKTSEQQLQELCQLFLGIKTAQEMRSLFEDILTPQEIKSISERLQIIEALVQGKPQRDIAKTLGTSIGTITRGSRVVQYGNIDWKKKLGK